MRSILLLTLLLIGFNCFSHEESPEGPEYQIVSNDFDSSLKSGQSKIVFVIYGFQNVKPMRIVYSISNTIDTVFLKEQKMIENIVRPGIYNFDFFYNLEYREISISKLELKECYKMVVSLHFKAVRHEGEMQVKKPVIYLYSPITQDVEVKVEPVGKMTFTYPTYDESWKVTVQADGKLKHKDGDFNYLFWESEQALSWNDIKYQDGSIVSKSNTIKFLEKNLDDFGLTSEEKADFITFWGPQLMKNESNFIHFVVNEDCDLFADLNVNPKPEHIYRIYLVYADAKLLNELEPFATQHFTKIDRSGFTMIEWGGVNISPEF